MIEKKKKCNVIEWEINFMHRGLKCVCEIEMIRVSGEETLYMWLIEYVGGKERGGYIGLQKV